MRLAFLSSYWNNWFVDGFPRSDSRSLDSMTMNILWGRGLSYYFRIYLYYSFRVPLYPIFLSMIYNFFGHNYLAAKVIQCVISAATVVIIYLIALSTFRRKSVAVSAGIISVFYLPFIYYAHCLLTETLFIFLLSLSVLLLIHAAQKRSIRIAVCSGVICGLASLTRSSMVSLLPFFGLWLIAVSYRDIKKLVLLVMGFYIALILVMSPWMIRNYRLHGKPMLATVGMRHLWNGADPKYEGSYYSRIAWREALWMKPGATEAERIDMLSRRALDYISRYPSLYLRFCQYRLFHLWFMPPNPLRRMSLKPEKLFRSLPFFVIPFGAIGLVVSMRRWRQALLLGGIICVYSIFHSIFGGTERFRIPIDWIFIIFASRLLMTFISPSREPLFDTPTDDDEFFEEPPDTPGTGSRRLKRIAWASAAVIVAVYLAMVLPQYLRHKTAFAASEVDQAEIEAVLRETGYHEQWVQQGRQLYTVRDIFDMRKEAGDPRAEYPEWIVAWTGEMHYIVLNEEGRIDHFLLSVNAGGQHLGDGKFSCKVDKDSTIKVINPAEGTIATIIGYTAENSVGAPNIRVLGIIPYDD